MPKIREKAGVADNSRSRTKGNVAGGITVVSKQWGRTTVTGSGAEGLPGVAQTALPTMKGKFVPDYVPSRFGGS